MTMRKKVLLSTFTILFLFILAYGLSFIPHRVFHFTADEVSEIMIIDGSSGERVIISDPEVKIEILTNLNSIHFQKKSMKSYSGSVYGIYIYDENKELTHTIMVKGSGGMSYNHFNYTPTKNTFDIELLEQLLNESESQRS